MVPLCVPILGTPIVAAASHDRRCKPTCLRAACAGGSNKRPHIDRLLGPLQSKGLAITSCPCAIALVLPLPCPVFSSHTAMLLPDMPVGVHPPPFPQTSGLPPSLPSLHFVYRATRHRLSTMHCWGWDCSLLPWPQGTFRPPSRPLDATLVL
jgi:hypothetical protein